MPTTLYLVRQAAAPRPRQAELTRDFLAVRPIDACYCAPTPRSAQTALLLAAPHGIRPQTLAELAETTDTFWELQRRVALAYDDLLETHVGQSVLVVAPRAVHAAYLANLLGLRHDQADQLRLDRCGISVIVREAGRPSVATLNASFHLQGASSLAA